MKTPLLSALMPVVAIGSMTLLLGCEEDSKKSGASGVGAGALAAISTNAPTQTNAPIATQPAPKVIAAPPVLSPGVDEIVSLAQASVRDEVLLAYIENSPAEYKLKVDEILYLHDLGLSAQVIAAMVRHDTALQEQAAAPAPATTNTVPAAEAPAAATGQAALQPGPTNVVTPPDASQPASYEQPQQQVTYNYFYNSLSPYGNWVEVADYGWCWQPTVSVINVGWRPYCDRGRWMWTDCGWYWQSDYSWGWIPFHYGRWHLSGPYGWVWVPDTVWGPAWVTWRYSNAYCGWAPLPPRCYYDVGFGFRYRGSHVGVSFDFGLGYDCYTFISLGRFCDRTPWYHTVPRSQAVAVFNNCTVVNNYIVGNNNHVIVNVGPGTSGIAAASRSEIRKVALRDVNPTPGKVIKADRLDRDGATLAVYRPKLPEQSAKPPTEIVRRQQESRKRSETLVSSDVVKLASEQRTPLTPQTRGSAVSPRNEVRPKADTGWPRRSGAPPTRAINPSTPSSGGDPGTARSEKRNTPAPGPTKPAPSDARPGQSGEAPRRAPESRGREERPTAAPAQPAPRREVRPDPAPRQPVQPQTPRSGDRSYQPERPNLPPNRAPEPRSEARPSPQVITPPAPRQEPRRSDSLSRDFSRPAYTPPTAQQSAPAVAPRQSAPSYNPPASPPPRSYSPPPSRSVEAHSVRPSSPPAASAPSRSESSSSRPSTPPSRSDGGRRER